VKESDRTAIAGALVSSATPGLLLLRAPLGLAHAKGVTVNARALTPAGPARQLKLAASRGDSVITLDSSGGLVAGGILRIGTDVASEIAVISVAGPGADQVTLSGPLVSSHPVAAPIQALAPGVPTGSTTLARDADADDGVLMLAGPLAGASVELADGARREYRDLGALSDADGFYHLDGVTGAAALDLRALASGFGDVTRTVAIAYDNAVKLVGFRLSP
jgi:hypothetical protein